MGSIITLGIENFEVDWGKNSFFVDHSCLFQQTDVTQIPYYYADGIVEIKEGLSRPLGAIKKRLDLLGYSLQSLPQRYQMYLDDIPDYYPREAISFEQFSFIIRSIDLGNIKLDPENEDYDLGKFVSQYIFREPEIRQYLPTDLEITSYIGTLFENLDPYITLRILAENTSNEEKFVQWRYADVVAGGWVERDEIIAPLPEDSKILIVTEGSSDAYIIERAICALRPEISDFFYFVDMEEHYPFTGTGNLFRFCQGLSSIKIQNKVLAIFDNDAAGIEKYIECQNLASPKNMHICRLPHHTYFEKFRTLGPNGASLENINGSAVAIECFLDLNQNGAPESIVRWTSYNRALHKYHGELEGKEAHVRMFKKANLFDGSYDTTRLEFLIDYLVDEWIAHST